jgi:hypothetical protein
MKTLTHTIATIALTLGSTFAASTWQVGTFAGAEYNETENETSPIVLPWLAYQSEHWNVNPVSVQFKNKWGFANWRVGLALDHGAWSEEWTEAFAAATGVEMFLGPIRLDNSAQITAVETNNWTTRHTLGTMLPVAPSVYLGLESGVSFSQTAEAMETQSTWVNGIQVLTGFDQWRFMALGSWNRSLDDQSDTVSGMLSVAYEW